MAKKAAFDYFESFEMMSDLAVKEASILVEAVQTYTSADEFATMLDSAHTVENDGDHINHEIFHNTAVEFITPIEREDIIALAQNLDTVLDDIEDVMMRFYMFDVQEMDADALTFANIIKDACAALHVATSELRNYKKAPREIQELIIKVNDAEEQGDRLYRDAIHRLYHEKKDDPFYVSVWSQIYSKMEKCCDACEHAADSISMVLLKNS